MRIDEINERLSAIAEEMNTDGVDLDALTEEVRNLKTEKAEIEKAAEKRAEIRKAVENGEGTIMKTFVEEKKEDRIFTVDSEEYRTAWIKKMQGKDLNDMEKRAFTTANGAISELVVNDIMSVVRDHAPLMERINMVYSASKVTYYVEGTNTEAIDHTENAAITPAADAVVAIDLTPAEIVKLVQVSDSARQMSVAAFNTWLSKQLGEAIARKINSKIVAAIGTAASTAGTALTAANVQTLLGSVKGEDLAIVCNRKTLFTGLLPLQDNGKTPIIRFDGNGSAYCYGVEILVDDNVADGTVLAGDMAKCIGAMAETITVREGYDIDTNSFKYIGVAVFDVQVGIASAFSKIVVG